MDSINGDFSSKISLEQMESLRSVESEQSKQRKGEGGTHGGKIISSSRVLHQVEEFLRKTVPLN